MMIMLLMLVVICLIEVLVLVKVISREVMFFGVGVLCKVVF